MTRKNASPRLKETRLHENQRHGFERKGVDSFPNE